MSIERVGFIGLGIMGRPMAKNLIKAGYRLVVHNRSRKAVRELVSAGAEEAYSPAEVAERSSVVITMLPDSPDVEDVTLGENGIIYGMKSGNYYIDMSSISPSVARHISEVMESEGVHMLDAPVSGGEKGAIDGTLAIMVGGRKEDFEYVKPLLEVMGSKVTYVGSIGSGNTVKLVNQIIVALNIAAFSEAFALGVRAGIDPSIIYDAIREGMAGSKALDLRMPHILEGDFRPGFKLSLHFKDINNAMTAAGENGVPLFLTSVVREMMKKIISEGDGESDHSSIVKFYEELVGVEVRNRCA